MTEREEFESMSEICLMDGGYYFWSIVMDNEELSDLIASYGDGEMAGIVDAYLEIFDPNLPPLISDRTPEEEREVWIIYLPEPMKMAIDSVVAKTILGEERNLIYNPVIGELN